MLSLEQPPRLEAALIAIDNRTGQVRAMVGGFSFARSKFNRATQARRQVGSLFKPIVYSAAIDRGFTPLSVFIDEPVAFDVGAGQPPYSPQNYDRKYEGAVTLRHALEDSRNIPAVKAMSEIGPDVVVEFAQRFGFGKGYTPYLSLALGAAEATLEEMTSAYSAFPNQGVRMAPYTVVSIIDREGNLVDEHRPEPHEALRADAAYVMTNLLQGVVEQRDGGRGTNHCGGRWPGRPARWTTTPTPGSSASTPTSPSASGSAMTRRNRSARHETGATRGTADLDGLHEGVSRRRRHATTPPGVRSPGEYRVREAGLGGDEVFIAGSEPQP